MRFSSKKKFCYFCQSFFPSQIKKKTETKQEQCYMPKYPRPPKSVYSTK